ncbi:hypothetical protein BDV26DRAFT_254660 [Aspergillus bertholletiae]|uniref:Uncharacterized protein n=1 Tax=Aspergillus bertholletiae TaxID=1226010 RepID=A0A5N7BJQ1_9EURO|nr:hypothetical protein BDV26DRAFT_254660 [Aspergillus bertholletiae]
MWRRFSAERRCYQQCRTGDVLSHSIGTTFLQGRYHREPMRVSSCFTYRRLFHFQPWASLGTVAHSLAQRCSTIILVLLPYSLVDACYRKQSSSGHSNQTRDRGRSGMWQLSAGSAL